jgi:hypothetical protein
MTANWIIETLYVRPAEAGLTNVVVTANWRCNGSQGQYAGTCYGSTTFEAPDPQAFTPYSDLTQDDVLNWVFNSGVDKAGVEANVQQQIDNQINPPILTPPLPWVKTTTTEV